MAAPTSNKAVATMMLHRAGNIAVQALRAPLREDFQADLTAGLNALAHLEEPGTRVDLSGPNATVCACLAAGVEIGDLEEAVQRAKYNAEQERIAR
jgi:hypothetical protein